MKIAIVYDTNNKGIAYKSVQFIINEIQKSNINTSIKEFFIPDDFNIISSSFNYSLPIFYDYSLENIYCDYSYEYIVKTVSDILNKSDFIILVSSNANHNIGSQMYNLLEHLSYQWLPHRLNSLMVNKIALAISDTSSLSIFSHANMTLSRNLRFWGINKHSIFSKSLSKYNLNNLSHKKQQKLSLELKKLSLKIVNRYRETSAVIVPNFKNNNPSYFSNTYKSNIIKLSMENNRTRRFIIKRFKKRKIL